MKKKILSGIFALALLIATGYGVNQSMKSDAAFSDMALANVEALAQSESDLCLKVCDGSGNGCFCYHWYAFLRETNW